MTIDLTIWQILLLLGAGFVSGAINAAAGGGSLISFPALLVVGYPPITANVTNNVATVPGYVGGAFGYRHGLAGQRKRIVLLVVACILGSAAGVGLILVSSQSAFMGIVPFLVLASCALLVVQPKVSQWVGRRNGERERPGVGAFVAQVFAAAYGGYFSAALGVAVLALLGLTIEDTLQRLNALKAFLQLVIGVVSAVGFALLTPVAWIAVAIVGFTSLIGGELGARFAQRVSDRALRLGIVAYGVAAAIWLFFQ